MKKHKKALEDTNLSLKLKNEEAEREKDTLLEVQKENELQIQMEKENAEIIIKEKDEMGKKLDELLQLQDEQEIELEAARSRVADLEEKKNILNRRISGLRSGISRRREVSVAVASTKSSCEEPCLSPNVKTSTLIEDIIKRGIIVVNEVSCEGIIKGIQYFGNNSKFKRSSDGKTHRYVKLPEHKEPYTKLSRKEVQKRAKFVNDITCNVANSVSSDTPDKESEILYTELIRLNPDLFQKPLKEAGLHIMDTMLPSDAIDLQSILRLPNNKVRNLSVCLSNLKMNILPYERKIWSRCGIPIDNK